jgi:hypothetical protein
LANILFWSLESKIKAPHTRKLWGAGILLGTLMPTLGILNNVPHEVFGLPADKQFLIYPFAMTFYALVWRYAIHKMNTLLSLTPEK